MYEMMPQRVSVYGHRRGERLPLVLKDDVSIRSQLPLCRYVLITYESTQQWHELPFYASKPLMGHADPVFVSHMLGDPKLPAVAVLLRVRD